MSTSEYTHSAGSQSAAAVDPDQVERAKREIQGLVLEIAELSKSQIAPQEFYDAMLNKIVSALAAPGGAVWTVGDGGGLQLAYQINLNLTGLRENPVGQAQHSRLLYQVLQSNEGALVAPHSGAGDAEVGDSDDQAAANPTDFLLVLAPMHNDQGPQGIVEIFQRTGARITTQRGYLRFLLQVCELAGDFLKARRLRHLTEKQSLWEQLESFTRTAHEVLDVRKTAYTIANEGRRLVGCDRVSVAIRRGNRCPVESVSGQDTFDKRSNVVTLLGKLAAAVVKTGEDVWYSGDTSDMAPQVEAALEAYVDESHTKAMAILPLTKPYDKEAMITREEEREPPEVIGALIVEQMVDSRTPEGFLQRVDVVRNHSATALTNALEYEGLFLMPLWRFLGRGTRLFRGRTLPKTIAALVAVVALVGFFGFYQVEFKLEGDGRLRPATRSKVWANENGFVRNIHVKHDEAVTKGQVLIEQWSPELEKEIEETRGLFNTSRADLLSKERQRSSPDITEAEELQLDSDIRQLKVKVAALSKAMELERQKLELLKVRSPLDGRVVTWSPTELLLDRPVNRGEAVLEVADPTGDWELEVLMPEYRMGHVTQAWTDSNGDLPVTFFLATSPEDQISGKVVEIHRNAEVRGDDGNTVLVRVSFDQQLLRQTISNPKIGAGATAKIHCGRRAIGYVWFHDLVDFVRAKILFRIF